MSNDIARLAGYLAHIVVASDKILGYAGQLDEAEFRRSTLVQDAIIRNLEVIGEASRNILKRYPEFAAEHSRLPLSEAYEMRNALSHGYFQIDVGIVWNTI